MTKLYTIATLSEEKLPLGWKLLVSYPTELILTPVNDLKKRMLIMAAIAILIAVAFRILSITFNICSSTKT